MQTIPDELVDPVGYRRWRWTQVNVEILMSCREKARATLAYLDRTAATQRANGLNPPSKQAKIERKNRAPHLAIIAEIDAELASRS